MARLLPQSSIPETLWSASRSLLRLPASLVTVYASLIESRGLWQLALTDPANSGSAGGESIDETNLHFATRFSASCGRVVLVALDPKAELREASDRIVAAFSGGKVALLDIPCGSGASAAALLTTLAALREQDRLPAHPLEVDLLGGDKSTEALSIATTLWTNLAPYLRTQGIELRHECVEWDVKDSVSTVELVSKWIGKGGDARLHFVLAANFSAFLGSSANLKKAQVQLNQIFMWAKTRSAQIVWIEPQTSVATSVLRQLLEGAIKVMRSIASLFDDDPIRPYAETQCEQQSPLQTTRMFAVRLSLMILQHRDRVP